MPPPSTTLGHPSSPTEARLGCLLLFLCGGGAHSSSCMVGGSDPESSRGFRFGCRYLFLFQSTAEWSLSEGPAWLQEVASSGSMSPLLGISA